jgi:hypothetical protein
MGWGQEQASSPLLDQLMRAADKLQVVKVVEFVDNFRAEKPPSPTGADLPRVDILGVGPHEIAERALQRCVRADFY